MLFDTIEGFHRGSLDLLGRHRARYEAARPRFDQMAYEFKETSEHIVVKYREVSLPLDKTQPVMVPCYSSDPPDVWENYKLLLLDLPPELLDHVMSLSHIIYVRPWTTVCRTLREHALQRLDAYCDLSMKRNVDMAKARELEGTSPDALQTYLQCIIFAERDALLDRMTRLLARPAALERIRTLAFGEDWTHDHAGFVERMGCAAEVVAGRAHELLAEVLRASAPVRLIFRAGYLSTVVWRAVAASGSLRGAAFSTRLVEERPEWPPARSIINLHICIPASVRPPNQWNIIPLCPSAVALKVISIERWGSVIPENVFGSFPANPMAHLQRLDLQHIVADSLFNLAEALAAIDRAPLTHLSIAPVESTIYGDVVYALIDAFRHAPDLRVLHMAGVQYAYPELFSHLGQCAPGLEALVLEHRASESDKPGYSARWPCPAYEYAPRLAAFPRLRHLGLNMAMANPSYASQMLERMENGYAGVGAQPAVKRVPRFGKTSNVEDELEDAVGGDEAEWTGKLFAIHGKSLKSLCFHEMERYMTHHCVWSIGRDDGKVSLKGLTENDEEYMLNCMPMYHSRSWELSSAEMKKMFGL
ncbi:hypothetical protein HDZ31DRAFT_80977 [Schizophyllum fasciatum]